MAFFEHDDISDYHRKDERVSRETYVRQIEEACHSEFTSSFLNIPNFDDQLYERMLPTIWRAMKENWVVLASIGAFLLFLLSNDRIQVKFEYLQPTPKGIEKNLPKG